MLPNSQTKIPHICKVYLPVKGGMQRVVQSITNLLSKRYTHHVLTSGEGGAIRDQKEGIKVEPNDSRALAEAMTKIASDEKLASTLGDNGY